MDEEKGSVPEAKVFLKCKEYKNGSANKDNESDEGFKPPDGGWGWVVAFSSMLVNGTVFGIINTFGILYVSMLEEYAKDDPTVSFKTSFVGSVCTGVTFLMCIVSSVLSDRVGIRPVAVIGGVLGCIGLVSSAFVTQLELLYLTFGILLGVGASFVYSPSLVILGHYFKKHMGLVNGLVALGSSIFSILLSLALPRLLEHLHIKYTFLVLGGLYVVVIIGSCTFKPVLEREEHLAALTLSTESVYEHCYDCCSWTRKFLNVRIWRNRAYVTWAIALGVALFGYFVPFFHLVKYSKDTFPDSDGNLLITYLQITSGIGRLVFGKVADFECISRLHLQQVAFLVMGILASCIPLSPSYGGLIAIVLIMGFCDGIFVCLLGPIAYDIVGPREASQAIGFLLGIFSIPFVVGPPIAGLLYDHLHSYDIAFYCAGAPPIIGSIIMFFIPKVKQNYPAVTDTENFASISMIDVFDEQAIKAQIERKKHAEKFGPARTELEIVKASDILGPYKSESQVRFTEDDSKNIPNEKEPLNDSQNSEVASNETMSKKTRDIPEERVPLTDSQQNEILSEETKINKPRGVSESSGAVSEYDNVDSKEWNNIEDDTDVLLRDIRKELESLNNPPRTDL